MDNFRKIANGYYESEKYIIKYGEKVNKTTVSKA